MARIKQYLALFLLIINISCSPQISDRLTGIGGEGDEPASGQPGASPTSQVLPGIPQVAVLSPLQIDSQRGRLYAVAQVNGEPKLAVMDAADGRLLAAWDSPGELALDSAHDRLVVDRGTQGVALLTGSTGETQAVVSLPGQDAPPPPQVNSANRMVYAFREATIHVIDPAIQGVVRAVPLSVEQRICDAPAGDAPIYRTAFDAAANRLYLTFITSRCVPWAVVTIVALDAAKLEEVGRMEAEITHQTLAYNKHLFGGSVSRLGPTRFWAWDTKALWVDESGDYAGAPAGMVADTGRKMIYEAIGESIRIIDPRDRGVTAVVEAPFLRDSRLAGHDPAGDMLYFVSTTGRLYLWPAANLFNTQSPPTAAPSPLPLAPITSLALSPKSAAGHATAAIVDVDDCPIEGGGLYLLTASGGWYPSETNPNGACEAVAAVVFSPNYANDSLIIAAVNDPPAIMRSVDIGRSWTAADTPFPEGTYFRALLPSPNFTGDQTLYSLTSAGLLYRSRDGGRNWQVLSQRLDHITAIIGADGSSNLFGTRGGRLLRSGDAGETWAEVGATPGGEPVTLLAATPSTDVEPILLVFSEGGQLSRSIDSGASWEMIMATSPAAGQLAVAHDVPQEERPVFLLHEGAVVASYDGMASVWAAAAVEDAARYRPTAIAVPPDFAAAPYLTIGTADGQIIRLRADAPQATQ